MGQSDSCPNVFLRVFVAIPVSDYFMKQWNFMEGTDGAEDTRWPKQCSIGLHLIYIYISGFYTWFYIWLCLTCYYRQAASCGWWFPQLQKSPWLCLTAHYESLNSLWLPLIYTIKFSIHFHTHTRRAGRNHLQCRPKIIQISFSFGVGSSLFKMLTPLFPKRQVNSRRLLVTWLFSLQTALCMLRK